MFSAETVFNFLRNNRGLPFRTMSVFNYLLEAALMGGVLILLLMVVRKFFRKQLGNRAIYLAWLLVAIRLLVPIALPNPVMNELRPTFSSDQAARPVADQFRVRFQDAASDLSFNLTVSDSPVGQATIGENGYTVAAFVQDVAAYTSYGWTGKWFFFAYLAAAGGVVVWMTVRNALFLYQMKKQRVSAISGEMETLYLALCKEQGVKPIPVYQTDPLPGACLVGVLRPYIALPLTMTADQARLALLHELCHYKARDNWWALLRNLCCVVQWFNPLVWLGAKLSRLDGEMACDDRVTRLMDTEERRAYASALLTAAARRSSPSMTVLATGMTSTGKRLQQRMAAILHNKAVQRWALITFMAVACAALLAAFGTRETEIKPVVMANQPDHEEEISTFAYLQENEALLDGLRKPVADAAGAVSVAQGYIASPLLTDSDNPMGSAPDWCVFQSDYGWHVSMTNGSGNTYFLLLGSDGSLKTWATEYSLSVPSEYQADAPKNTADVLTSYADLYARYFLGASDASEVVHTGSVTATERAWPYYLAEGKVGDTPFTMAVEAYTGVVAAFTLGEGYGDMQTQLETVAMMRQYAQSELGVNQNQARMTLSRVMWDNDRQRLLGVISEQTTWMSQDAATRLIQTHGKQERYAMQLVVDPAGKGYEALEFLPQAGYPADATVLDEGIASTTMTTFEIIKDRYLVQAGTLPAGTAYQVLDNRTMDDIVPTGGAFAQHGMTLVRFTHPTTQQEYAQWVGTSALSNSMDAAAPQWHKLTCVVNGVEVTMTGTDWADTAEDGYYLAPPDNAITAEEAVAIAMKAICDDQGLNPADLATLPIEFGYRYDSDSRFGPSFWRVDIPDPRSSNLGYEIYINAHTGEILDYSAFGNG